MEWRDADRRLPTGNLDRRSLLKALGSVGLGVAMMSATKTNPAFAADQVSVYTWTTYNNPKLFQSYIDKHGKPDISFFGDTDEAFSNWPAAIKSTFRTPAPTTWSGGRNPEC